MSEAAKKEPMSPRAVRHSFTLTDNETGDITNYRFCMPTSAHESSILENSTPGAGIFTYDPGFTSTASCTSDITYMMVMRACCSIAVTRSTNLLRTATTWSVLSPFLHGDLPSPEEKSEFDGSITQRTMLHEHFSTLLQGFFKRNAHPMAIMVGFCRGFVGFSITTVRILTTPCNAGSHPNPPLIAKMPTIAAYAYKYSLGQPFPYPDNKLDYASNLLRMFFSFPHRRI
ncbi:MAG: hypothetical protein CM1200mP41_18390 [Gammaproteobacteria bacterium]|nr:MAG: hypothetical protein CM1200mP41_18390 [Gammaproteobacteria bacterium]